MDDKDERPDGAPSQRPRSPRVPVEFSLQIEGVDGGGSPFKTRAKATKISRGGATIAMDDDIDVVVGDSVKLIPPFGGALEAQINGAWIDEIDGRRRIGVKLLHADGWFGE
jgi:PilZ domain-containing protein